MFFPLTLRLDDALLPSKIEVCVSLRVLISEVGSPSGSTWSSESAATYPQEELVVLLSSHGFDVASFSASDSTSLFRSVKYSCNVPDSLRGSRAAAPPGSDENFPVAGQFPSLRSASSCS